MNKYMKLHELVFNKPHLCTPEYAETVLAVLSNRLGIEEGAFQINGEAKDKKESNVVNGIYHLPIVGSMVHRGSSLDAASGIQSYQSIKSSIQQAISDPSVKGIMLEFDSPGGSVAGAFDLRDFVMEAKEHKPIYAYARDSMCSAAYLIGSAATKVYGSQTSSVGSIGVVAMHIDQSEKNKQAGIKPTFVYAGKYKTAGNPHAPLEGEEMDYLQESVNDSYDMFVKAVAQSRSLKEDVVRGTEARVYRGAKAKKLGLIDGVKTFDAAMEELANISQGRVLNQLTPKGTKMETDVEKLQADLDALKAKHESLQAAVIAKGYTITAEGINKPEPEAEPEMIEVAGVMTDKASLPAHVITALEAAAKEKADAELKKEAVALFPNFSEEASVAIFTALGSLDEASREVATKQLKAADSMFSELLEEKGEAGVEADLLSAKEKLNLMITDYAKEHNISEAKATSKVIETKEGNDLYKQAMKERN